MPAIYEQFKSSFVSGVFQLTGKVWWKYIVVSLIQSVIGLILAIPLLLTMFNLEAIKDIISNPNPAEWGQQFNSNPEALFSFMGPDPDYAVLITSIVIFVVISLLLQAWVFQLYFIFNQDAVAGSKIGFGEVLSKSFNSGILRLLGLYLVLIIAYMGIMGLVMGGFVAHWSLGVVALLFGVVFIMRFVVAIPALIHGDMSIGDSIRHSLDTMTWKRALLFFLLSIVAGIAMFVASFILVLIFGIIGMIPIIGQLFSFVFNILFSAIISALAFGTMTGLYYRYTDQAPPARGEIAPEDLEKHLIDGSHNYTS